ncbi:MAG: RNA polymerase sigma factor [Pseudomonadota bacterium]
MPLAASAAFENTDIDDAVPAVSGTVVALKRPDPEAEMGKILRDHQKYMRAVALKICATSDMADDVVQQTCLQAWRYRDRFDYDRCPKPWLVRVLRNEYLQMLRRNSRLSDFCEEDTPEISDNSSSSEALINNIAILDGLRTLNDEQRTAILLVLANGYTYEEAADLSGSTVGTMKSRVSRARSTLTQLLKP